LKLRAEIIKDLKGFEALEVVWNPLLGQSDADTIFLTYEWIFTCWAHFCHDHQLFIVVVWKEEAIVAIAPLMVTKRDGFRQLCMIRNNYIDHHQDFIIDDSVNREQVIRKMFGVLDQDEGWDFFRFYFPTNSANFPVFSSVLAQYPSWRVIQKEQDSPFSLYIPLKGTFEEYFHSLKKSFRKDIARYQRNMEKNTFSHSFLDEIDPERIKETVDEMVDIKTVSLKAKYGDNVGPFDSPSTRSFFIDIAQKTYFLGWLRIPTLLIDGEIAARFLCLQYKDKYYGIMCYYHTKYGVYSPSQLLTIREIKHCFELKLNEFDLMGGPFNYKHDYNVNARIMQDVLLFQSGLKGYIASRRIRGAWMLDTCLRKLYWQCGAKLRRIPYMSHIIDAVKKILKIR